MVNEELNVKFIKVDPFKIRKEFPELIYIYTDKSAMIQYFASGLFLPPNIENLELEGLDCQKQWIYLKNVFKKLKQKYDKHIFIVYCHNMPDIETSEKIEEIAHLMLWLDDPNYFIKNLDEEHYITKQLEEIIKNAYQYNTAFWARRRNYK